MKTTEFCRGDLATVKPAVKRDGISIAGWRSIGRAAAINSRQGGDTSRKGILCTFRTLGAASRASSSLTLIRTLFSGWVVRHIPPGKAIHRKCFRTCPDRGHDTKRETFLTGAEARGSSRTSSPACAALAAREKVRAGKCYSMRSEFR
jgi:hypothetical protein